VSAPTLTVAQLDQILGSVQLFLGWGQWFGSKTAAEWNARITELRKANNEALIVDLIPIISDAVTVNKPLVDRTMAVIKKHAK